MRLRKKKYNTQNNQSFIKECVWVQSVIESCASIHHLVASKTLCELLIHKWANKVNLEDITLAQDYLNKFLEDKVEEILS